MSLHMKQSLIVVYLLGLKLEEINVYWNMSRRKIPIDLL